MAECWAQSHPVAEDDKLCAECARAGHATHLRFGKYRVTGFLGSGSFGSVYRAWDADIRRTVAIKFLTAPLDDSTLVVNSPLEIQSQGSLSHPAIVSVFDAALNDGYFIMEFVEGGTLAAWLAEDISGVQHSFTGLALALVDAVRVAHVQRIVHRDIKPANILLTTQRDPKISDFGLARLISESSAAQTFAGTPLYAAPEVLRGDSYGLDVDIYSLGTVFYEMWTGQLPFQANSLMGLALLKSAGTHPTIKERNPQAPQWISDLIEAMLGPPGDRPSAELVHAEFTVHATERRLLLTVDDFQREIAFLYASTNVRRSPVLLLSHLLANLEGVIGGIRLLDSDYGRKRTQTYLPKAYAWLCSLLTALDTRVSQIITYKYDEICPYCHERRCCCNFDKRMSRQELNTMLVERFGGHSRGPVVGTDKPFVYYKDMFLRLYGERNREAGTDVVGLQALSAVAHVSDALLRLRSLEQLRRVEILHLELSDLVAWFFALVNLHESIGGSFDFESAFRDLYGDKCYACGSAPCHCPEVEVEIRLVNWRSFV